MALIPQARSELAPGAVHVPGWLSRRRQRELVGRCREWSRFPAGMRRKRMPRGGMMSVAQVSLGWQWVPYRYTRTADDTDGAPVKPFPDDLAALGRAAVAAAYGRHDGYDPDIALINFYDVDARMGMHQDKDERSAAPVVSFSLGDSCVFRFGNTDNRNRPWRDVVLESGDLVVFGGPSRLAFHGVPRVLAGTGPDDIGLDGGRLNITLRCSGMEAAGQ